jgi:starch synthase
MTQTEPLKIVMFAAEVAPFTKVGGLGDVIGALPKALEKLGANISIVTPAYKSTLEGDFGLQNYTQVRGFDVSMGSSIEHAKVLQTRMEGTSIDVYFIGSGRYFDREGIYDDPVTREGYPDNMKRFIFFMKAGLGLILRIGIPLDIVHCHDSQTALIPGMIRTGYRNHPVFANTGTLFTIHNLAYQGVYPEEALHFAGIDRKHFYSMSPFEYWNKVNFIKAGIMLADKVNTVSQTYAREIQASHEFGVGLEGVLQSRTKDVSGIVNGIDYAEWDPESDPLIPANFSTRDFSGKEKCKQLLKKQLNLPQFPGRTPLIGIVSRLVDQKGFDLIEEDIRKVMALNLQLAVLGTGQEKYMSLFQSIASRYPEKVAVRLYFDHELAHRMEAGCDMFLMPSKYEPCGLNQLFSMRYGTIPIVRATGGLADTVADDSSGEGTGFSFTNYSAAEMMTAIERALEAYADTARWQQLMIRAMKQDWSWDRSAHKYLELYRDIHGLRHR